MGDTSEWKFGQGSFGHAPTIVASPIEQPFVASIMPLDYNMPTAVILQPLSVPRLDGTVGTAPQLRPLEGPRLRPGRPGQ
jgi:hypothetical protein